MNLKEYLKYEIEVCEKVYVQKESKLEKLVVLELKARIEGYLQDVIRLETKAYETKN